MKLSTPTVALALASYACSAAAHGQGGLLTPRRYQYSRPATAFDLVSDMFTVPLFNRVPSQMNSMMRQLEAAAHGNADGQNYSPQYEVYHNPDTNAVELTMEIPGVTAKDLSIELENHSMLRIRGTRHQRKNGNSFTSEFEQLFQLDTDVDPEKLKVTLSAGVLRVVAPKKEREVRTLTVDVHEEDINDEKDEPNHIESVDGLEITTEDTS